LYDIFLIKSSLRVCFMKRFAILVCLKNALLNKT